MPRRIEKTSTVLLLLALTPISHAAAQDCSGLKPIPAESVDQTYSGNLTAKLDGLFKKFASPEGSASGTYKSVRKSLLSEFPNADQVYIWERVLYLQCEIISRSDLSDNEKQTFIHNISAQASQQPPTSANTVTNSGDNNTIIQGDKNSVSMGH